MLKKFDIFRVNYVLFFFSLFKALTFFVPLLLINILTPLEYVIFESGLAISNIAVIVLNFGVSAAVPLYLLKENKKEDIKYIYFHCVSVSSAMLCIALLSELYIHSEKLTFICISVSILCNVRVISSHKKTLSEPIKASFYEAYLFIALFTCVLFSKVFDVLSFTHINIILFFASLLLIVFASSELVEGKADKLSFKPSKLFTLYSFSSLALIVSVVVVFFVTLIRVLGEGFVTIDQYLTYSVYFRLASVAIIVFQFVLTLKFKDIYDSEQEGLDKSCILILFSVLIISLSIYVSNDIILPLLFSLEVQDIINNNSEVVLPIVLTMPLWAAIAVLENIISRERAFKLMLLYVSFASVVFFSFCLLAYLYGELSFVRIVYLHIVLLCILVISQLLALYKLDIKLTRILSFTLTFLVLGVFGASISS